MITTLFLYDCADSTTKFGTVLRVVDKSPAISVSMSLQQLKAHCALVSLNRMLVLIIYQSNVICSLHASFVLMSSPCPFMVAVYLELLSLSVFLSRPRLPSDHMSKLNYLAKVGLVHSDDHMLLFV